jgi:hypothetical protein
MLHLVNDAVQIAVQFILRHSGIIVGGLIAYGAKKQ